jgi:tetratricopeptide (TPR) repeat protein/transcriptional regulator with XRE-family HTH domain
MQRHDPSDFVVPDQFWERPETREALRARDAGALFQLVRRYAGASQTGLTMRTGIAKSEISAIMAGRRRVTSLERFEAIADGLAMPDDARVQLGLAPQRRRQPAVVLSGDDEAASVTPKVPAATRQARVWSILPPVRGFRGRESEVAAVANCLQAPHANGKDVSAAAVHGIAGVGKTQLARAYADSHKEEYNLGWWVSAETRLDIATGVGQLAIRLGASEEWSSAELLNFLFEELRSRESWLLIFDNVTTPADVESFIPLDGGARGHVIITSRNPSWRMLATPIGIDVLSIGSASRLLTDWSDDEDTVTAEALALELGQLPLAIEQAAAYAADTSISLGEYLDLFRLERASLLEQGSGLAYSGTVAATVVLTLERLATTAPLAMRLLEICALCSPDSLPLKQFLTTLQNLEDPLIGEPDAIERLEVFGSLRQSGLLMLDSDDEIRLHRLTKVVIEARLGDRRQRVADAVALLAALFPRTPSEPATWPTCAQLASHAASVFVHAQAEDLDTIQLASLLTRVGRYFLCSGLSYADAADLHEQALAMRRKLHEGDHPEVARGLVHLAVDLNELGDPSRARELHELALEMRMRLYSGDHPDIAHSLDNLGNVLHILGRHDLARQHHEQGLQMRRRLHVGDHPNVAYSLNNLAGDLHELGDLEHARELNELALAMRQRLDPGDHPDIAHSFRNLASDLRAMGDYQEAIRLDTEALAMQQRLYPGDHPNTLRCLQSLAETCRALDQRERAVEFELEVDKMQKRLATR